MAIFNSKLLVCQRVYVTMLLGNMFIEVSACERLGRWQFAMAVMEKMQLQEVNQLHG